MRVLIIAHGYPPTARGGAEVYAESHARTLGERYGDDVLVLTRDADPGRPEFDVRETHHRGVPVVRVNNTFRTVRSFEESYRQPRLAALAAGIIDRFAPDVAHVHHLTCLSTQIPHHLRDRGVPCFMTLHDYWLLCHRGQLLDRDCRICHSPGACGRCVDDSAALPATIGAAAVLARRVEPHLSRTAQRALRAMGSLVASAAADTRPAHDAMEARLAHMHDVASCIERFYAPSAHLRRVFTQAGFPADRMQVSPYGFDREQFTRRPARPLSRPLRIGFVGSLMLSKAPHLLLEAFRRLPAGAATLELFGAYTPYHGDDGYRAVLDSLLRTPHVTRHDWQPETAIAQVYAGLDVLVVPSIWPENSPLVIHEALLSGVPVIASNIGGVAELIRHEENGLLFTAGDVGSLQAALQRLLREPGLLPALAGHASTVRSIQDDTASMRADYQAAVTRRAAGGDGRAQLRLAEPDVGSDTQPMEAAQTRVHAVVLNYGTPDQTLLTVRSLLAQSPPLSAVTVVDNSDTVECGRLLADLSDRVEFHSAAANHGYSGGMNLGIARALQAAATHVLLVNSDVTVPPDCCARLVAALNAEPGAAIAGPTLLRRDTPDRIDSAGLSFGRPGGRMRMLSTGDRAGTAPTDTQGVDAVSGCLMLVERRVFDRIGLLDERYFFGFEDLDFCLRAREAGFGTIVTSARAYHARAQSLPAHSPDRLYYGARNQLHLATAAHGGASRVSRQVGIALLNVASALKAPPASVPARLRAVAAGCRDFYRGRFGARR